MKVYRSITCFSITFFFTSFFSTVCKAQSVEKNNALSLELGKTGLVYNLSYDHKFKQSKFGLRATTGSNFAQYLKAFTIGGGSYYLTGKTNNHAELGADINYLSVQEISDDQKGFAFIYPDYSISTYYLTLNLGYRHYGKKTMFRIGVSPGFTKKEFLAGGYISYGFLF